MPDVHDIPTIVPAELSIHQLEFPILRTNDNSFMLPTYSDIVYTSRDVDLEILDLLQTDLEMLLSSTVARSQYFEQMLHLRGKKRMKTTGTRSLKRTRLARAAKAIRFSKLQESPHSPKSQPYSGIGNLGQNVSASPPVMNLLEPEPCPIPQPKHSLCKSKKTAHKYWLSVERFCRPMSQYDITFLNCLTEAHKFEISRPFEVPPLGEHYSRRWARHDLSVQERASDPTTTTMTRLGMESSSVCSLNLLNKSKDFIKGSESLHSRRDVSSLQTVLTESINEVLAIDTDEECISVDSQDLKEQYFVSNTSQTTLLQGLESGQEKTLKMQTVQTFTPSSNKHFLDILPQETNRFALEDRLKRELADVGAIQLDTDEHGEEDEIVAEIKRCQSQLKFLLSNNLIQLERCTKLAEQEMRRQDIRKKLRGCDSSIIEIHNRINQCKQKKQPCSEHDRYIGWKLLKEREQLIKEIDSLDDVVV